MPLKLYRFHDFPAYRGAHITLFDFAVLRETPRGYWIDVWGKKKWVSKTARSRFAYPEIEKAKTNFKKRKERQLGFLKLKVTHVENVLKAELSQDETTYIEFGLPNHFWAEG